MMFIQPPSPSSNPLPLSSNIIPLPGRLFLTPFPNRIHQRATHEVHRAEPHGRSPDDSSHPPFLHQRLPPSPRQDKIHTRPGSANSGRVDLVTVYIEVAAEQENGREQQREELWGPGMLRGDECREECGRKGRFCASGLISNRIFLAETS